METRDIIRRLIADSYKSPRDFAIKCKINYVYLNKVLNGRIRVNDEFVKTLSQVLKIPAYQFFSDRPLIPYESKEPALNFNMPEGDIEGIKVFDTPACLGPGYNMDECRPSGYMPIPKDDLPKGFKSEPNRVVCFPTAGTSMAPTILPDSYIWVDRYVPAEAVLSGGIYAFMLPDGSITIKRLIRLTDHSAIIDADNPDPAERKETGSLKDFPMVLPLQEDLSVVRGRVIWILNRLVEKPKR